MISPIGNKLSGWKGFTLIEMLLVLVILGVVIGMAAPYFGGSYRSMELRQTAEDAANLMRFAQSQAILRNRTYLLVFSIEAGTYQVKRVTGKSGAGVGEMENVPDRMGRMVKVPEGVTVSAEKEQMSFFSDGTMEKNRLTFSSGGNSYVVSSYEQRGQVFVFSGEDRP